MNVATADDAIERCRTEAEWRVREERYALAMEAISDGLWDIDLTTGAMYLSPSAGAVLGYSVEELTGGWAEVAALTHPDDLPQSVAARAAALASGALGYELELRMRHKNGSYRWLKIRTRVVRDATGRPVRVVGSNSDVTERRQIQARLLQADRLVSVGTLAAGVAHEINNPLTYTLANLGVVAEELEALRGGVASAPGGDDVPLAARLEGLAQFVAEAREGAERVRRIVRDLKVFAQPEPHARAPLDVRAELDAALQIAWHEVRHRARLVKQYAPALPRVEAAEGHLAQVFVNLVLNAAQAIPDGDARRHEITVTVAPGPRAGLTVEVRDSGVGIAPDLQRRIFDPFFTTKPAGTGIGLGLPICHGIVTALGGEITVESAPGRGSAFRVWLPALHEPAAPDVVAASAPPCTRVAPDRGARRLRILVVDDEPALARSLARLFSRQHEVTTVTTGRAAIEVLGGAAGFDVVFCDVMMPEVSGVDVFEAVRHARPEQTARFVFMSGGAFTPRAREFLANVPNRKIDKPFDMDGLRALVRALAEAR